MASDSGPQTLRGSRFPFVMNFPLARPLGGPFSAQPVHSDEKHAAFCETFPACNGKRSHNSDGELSIDCLSVLRRSVWFQRWNAVLAG